MIDGLWGDGALFDQISDTVKELMAKAWDAGYDMGYCDHALGHLEDHSHNPYRT